MTSRKRMKSDPRALCAQLYPDDGVDPREERRRDARCNEKPDRKTRQLCKQAVRALQLALGALPRAGVLAGVFVKEATPAPHAGRLRVVVVVPDPWRREEVAAVLESCAGRLRVEVAAAITRRRAPELTFEVIAEGESHD